MILLVARGDARIDRKFKDAFGKGKMLPLEEVVELTGHPVAVFARSAWRNRCRSIWTSPCSISTKSCLPLEQSTVRYASVRRRWPK